MAAPAPPPAPRPKLYVFDLDNCCWLPEMFQLWGGGGAPFVGPDDANEPSDREPRRRRTSVKLHHLNNIPHDNDKQPGRWCDVVLVIKWPRQELLVDLEP